MLTGLLLALVPALHALQDEDARAPRPWLELPEGAARAACGALSPSTEPGSFPAEWAALRASSAWEEPATLALWAELVAAEHATAAPTPARRAALAILAARQGRTDAAWGHLAACAAEPAWVACALPALLPGVTQPAAPGGLPTALETGCVLAPLLPPASVDPETGAVSWTRMALRGFQVGEARLALTVALEPSGVEVDLELLEGGPVDLAVRMPAPEGYAITVEYVDWMRQDTLGAPLAVHLEPGAEPVVLWGRFDEQRVDFPAIPQGGLPAQLREGGLWWVLAEGEPAERQARAFAAILRDLLAIEVRVASHAPTPAELWTGTVVRVPSGDLRPWIARMCGAVETHLLGDPLPARSPR